MAKKASKVTIVNDTELDMFARFGVKTIKMGSHSIKIKKTKKK